MNNFSTDKIITDCGLIAQTHISDPKSAIQVAKAILAGGIQVMTVSMLEQGAEKCIEEITNNLPGMIVGASEVTEITQCEISITAGAFFIITPLLDRDIAAWCLEHEILLIPNCVTPSDMFAANRLGLQLLGFFPADSYGGIHTITTFSRLLPTIKWIPLGETSPQNLARYAVKRSIASVGCTWLHKNNDALKDVIERCRQALDTILGFELFHVGVNSTNIDTAQALAEKLHDAFRFKIAEGPGAFYASVNLQKINEELTDPTGNIAGSNPGAFYITTDFELMKKQYLGTNGHLGIITNSVERAISYLGKKGYQVDMKTAYRLGNRYFTVYLKDEFGGFAVHLFQKQEAAE